MATCDRWSLLFVCFYSLSYRIVLRWFCSLYPNRHNSMSMRYPNWYNRHSFRSKSRMIGTIAHTIRHVVILLSIWLTSSGPPSLLMPNSSVISTTYAVIPFVIRQVRLATHDILRVCAISCTFSHKMTTGADQQCDQLWCSKKTKKKSIPGNNLAVLGLRSLAYKLHGMIT